MVHTGRDDYWCCEQKLAHSAARQLLGYHGRPLVDFPGPRRQRAAGRERAARRGERHGEAQFNRPARPGAGRARYRAPDHKIYRKINVLELFRMTLIGAGVGEQSEGSESDFSIHAW